MKKTEILKAFETLNTELGHHGIKGEVGIVGGAAMVLGFNSRSATKDVDAIFEPASKMRQAVKKVAEELNLPDDWMNDAVKGLLPGKPKEKRILYQAEHLAVWMPEPEYLLAMKSIAARFDTRDADDLRILIQTLVLKHPKDVFDIIEKYYPKDRIPAKTQFFLEEIFDTDLE